MKSLPMILASVFLASSAFAADKAPSGRWSSGCVNKKSIIDKFGGSEEQASLKIIVDIAGDKIAFSAITYTDNRCRDIKEDLSKADMKFVTIAPDLYGIVLPAQSAEDSDRTEFVLRKRGKQLLVGSPDGENKYEYVNGLYLRSNLRDEASLVDENRAVL